MFNDPHPPRPESDEDVAAPVTVELYVRSLAADAAQAPQEAAIERLSRLERDGVVDEYAVHVWGRRVSPDTAAAGTSAGRFVLDRIERFRDWARRNGATLRSFFDTHEVDSSITGESYTAITVPSLTLAEYRGDDLVRVTPCGDGETVHTVTDHLDALEDGGGTDRLEADGASRVALSAGDTPAPPPGGPKG